MRTTDAAWTPAEETFVHVDLAVLLGVLGLVLVAAGWAASTGRLRRNYVIGMRTSAVLKTDATWRAAHERCAWSLCSSGLTLLTAGGLLTGFRPSEAWSLGIIIAATALAFTIVMVGAVQADRAARHVAGD